MAFWYLTLSSFIGCIFAVMLLATLEKYMR